MKPTFRTFSLRSLFLLVTVAAVGLALTNGKRTPDQLLADAKKALWSERIAWSAAINTYGDYKMTLDGRRLSLKAAKAIVASDRIMQVNLIPSADNNAVLAELARGFPRKTITEEGTFLHR